MLILHTCHAQSTQLDDFRAKLDLLRTQTKPDNAHGSWSI
jgi:hypothetical protein